MDLNKIKRSSSFWHRLSALKVRDPDGWNRGGSWSDFIADWCEPVTMEGFMRKLMPSTVEGSGRQGAALPNPHDQIICGDESMGLITVENLT